MVNAAGITSLDLYPGKDSGGNLIWPATSQIVAFTSSRKFKIQWQLGQMVRKPMAWEEWGGDKVYAGADRGEKEKFDYAKFRKEKEEREVKQKQAEIEKGIAEGLKKAQEGK